MRSAHNLYEQNGSSGLKLTRLKTMKININTQAKVKLTDKGRVIASKSAFVHIENDGTITTELWSLMAVFGPYIHMGADIPFEKNLIELVEPIES